MKLAVCVVGHVRTFPLAAESLLTQLQSLGRGLYAQTNG